VLGGGGARGAAHVGVLKELERLRIPVDAIAGTSMGAVVGGLYASGMSPAELELVVKNLDWAQALKDEPARNDLRFRRKEDEQRYPINPDVGLGRDGVKLPLGLIQGQRLDLLLRELTIDVSHLDDFDHLAIPFRAIAADIETGEAVVMGDGDLAKAIRASMSVPGVFAPVQIDGHMLVDGGIAGNLPVEIIREMNVDVIIAVDVEFPLYSMDELQSAIAISEQMLTILIRKETVRQTEMLGDDDILIRPELGTYGSADFANILTTVEPGVRAAASKERKLRELSVDDATYAAWLESRAQPRVEDRKLAFVRIEQDSTIATETFETRLRVQPGDPINVDALADQAARLHGLALFEKVGYRLEEEDDDIGVVFDARAKSWGPAFLRFGISLEDDFEGSTNFDARVRMIRPAVNRLGGEWRADLRLGSDLQILNEFYQPLRFDSHFFVAPYLDYEQSNVNLFVDQKVSDTLRISELTGGFDVGAEFGSIGEFRVGAYRGHGGSRIIVGDPTLPTPGFNTGGLRALLRFDTLDKAWFPREGLRADIEWRQSNTNFGADGDYDIIDTQFEAFTSRGKTTLGIGLEYSTTLSFDGAIQDLFRLGGFQRLSGFERNAISGPHSALAKFLFYRRIGDSPAGLFDAPVYFGASIEAGNVWESRSQMSLSSTLVHGSLFVGVDSVIGPLFLAAGVGEGGNSNVYLFIGAPPGR
jgi:NTE family protein